MKFLVIVVDQTSSRMMPGPTKSHGRKRDFTGVSGFRLENSEIKWAPPLPPWVLGFTQGIPAYSSLGQQSCSKLIQSVLSPCSRIEKGLAREYDLATRKDRTQREIPLLLSLAKAARTRLRDKA
jgi:hypothetical protein